MNERMERTGGRETEDEEERERGRQRKTGRKSRDINQSTVLLSLMDRSNNQYRSVAVEAAKQTEKRGDGRVED